jgi:hypothetical protein
LYYENFPSLKEEEGILKLASKKIWRDFAREKILSLAG